jgi:hypothetical protein
VSSSTIPPISPLKPNSNSVTLANTGITSKVSEAVKIELFFVCSRVVIGERYRAKTVASVITGFIFKEPEANLTHGPSFIVVFGPHIAVVELNRPEVWTLVILRPPLALYLILGESYSTFAPVG